jgi:hypothetical protein
MRCKMFDIIKVSRVLDDASVFAPINGKDCEVLGETASAFLSSDAVYVLMPNDGSVFIFVPYNEFIFNVHLGVLPEWRGKQAVKACRDAFAWMFANTPCTKIIGFEDTRRRDAIRFITLLGVDREGLLKNVDGKGMDMAIFGYSKPCV